MEFSLAKLLSDVTPSAVGTWVLVLMLALYGLREWRETRKLSLEDRLARRDGYAHQVQELHGENRALRLDLSRLHEEYDRYRKMCQEENSQLRSQIRRIEDTVAGLERRVATDAIELARLKGVDGIL